MRNELAASVIGILVTIILQSNNAVVCILISMVAGNSPIESFAKFILERWRNTCPKLKTLTVITQPFIDALIQIDESIILPINDSYVYHEPTKFVIYRCIDPETSEFTFCPYSHIFRYSRMSDKTIAAIIGFSTLITVILSQIAMGIILHSLCDGLFSEKFMIFINKIASYKIIWCLDWIIDFFMIFIGFILFPIIEPHSLFSPKHNPYAKLDPRQAHRLYPMLLGANLGQSMGGVAAAFAVPAAALYK
uniref:Uncharacterized protein n=1 Tax=Panagrolaimus sp. ES5 TaxID=591445 RepID=A0AC34F697_9BILA